MSCFSNCQPSLICSAFAALKDLTLSINLDFVIAPAQEMVEL
jgi:hypothetical protein